jgi:hypothetical protein
MMKRPSHEEVAVSIFSEPLNDPDPAAVTEGRWTSSDIFFVTGTPLI